MAQSNRDHDTAMAEYKQLAKCGLRVRVLIFGAMSIGHSAWGSWVLDEEESLPPLKAAYDPGISTWDTANGYSNGESERIIGKAIRKYNIPRHKVIILTKVFFHFAEKPDERPPPNFAQHPDYVNQGGLSCSHIINSVDASIKRLQTDYIDVLQIHRFDATIPTEETTKALHDVVASGKVRYIGASSMWAYRFATMQFCAEKNGWTKFISMQINTTCYIVKKRGKRTSSAMRLGWD